MGWLLTVQSFMLLGKSAHFFHISVVLFTKRNVLKKTATIYDPLGFLAPYVVTAKLLIQQASIEAADWDDPLLDHHQDNESHGSKNPQVYIDVWKTDIPQKSKPSYTCFRCFRGSIRGGSLHPS